VPRHPGFPGWHSSSVGVSATAVTVRSVGEGRWVERTSPRELNRESMRGSADFWEGMGLGPPRLLMPKVETRSSLRDLPGGTGGWCEG
jgi:hypothetical protein